MKEYSWKNNLYLFISCACFFVLWQCIAVIINNDIYLPRIDKVLRAILGIIKENNFAKVVLSSFFRTSFSYIIALILAVVLGGLSIMYPFFGYIIKPLNSIIRTIPTLVLIVLVLVWFDKNITPFIVGFAVVFPIIFEGVRNNIVNFNSDIIEMLEIYEVSKKDKIIRIYLPLIKCYIMNIFISTFSLTFKVVIAGEVHGQPQYGIGSQVQLEKVNFNTSGIFAWIIIIMILSFAFEIINKIINKKVYW